MGVGPENEKVFDALAWWLHRHGVRPDHITFLQVPVYAAMIFVGLQSWRDPALNWALLWTFGWLQVGATIIDGADGILARRTGTVSRHGHLLDALFDIAGIGLTIWIVFLHYPSAGNWLLGLLLVNFFVYLQNEIQGTKSVTYTRGPLTLAFVFEPTYPGVLMVGTLVPLVFGTLLIFTRVAWRKRLWTYWQFFTAGRRHEYKAVPREQRTDLASDPRIIPPGWHAPPKSKEKPPTGGGGPEPRRTVPDPTERAP